jgi:ribosomal protein S18 acetylase RimI-like enzyme
MSTKLLPQKLTREERATFEGLLPKLPKYEKRIVHAGVSTVIRTLDATDLESLVKLVYDIWHEESHNKDLPYPRVKYCIQRNLEESNPIMFVAEREGKVVAFIWGCDLAKGRYPHLDNYLSSGKHSHVGYIDELGVASDFRKQGIAGELLDSYVELARQNGIDDLVIDTMNPAAMKLYKEKKHYTPVLDPISKQEVVEQMSYGVYRVLHLEIKPKARS